MNTKEKKMSNLEKLYYNFDKLIDNFDDTPEVKEARNNLEKVLGREAYTKYETEISILESKSEKQGFITGFQYAVSLLTSGKAVQNEILL